MCHSPLDHALRRLAGLPRLLAGFFIWAVFHGALEAAYKYPIGIPAAWIDPDIAQPSRPDPWTGETPGYYLVNFATGTDTGRVYGHPGAPRKTIPNPIPAGSRVEVGGIYAAAAPTGTLFITFAGSPGEWIAATSGPAWLVGSTSESRASFTGSVFFVGEFGCIEFVDNFGTHKGMSINSAASGKGRKAHHFLFRNNEIKGTNSATDGGGVAILGNSDIGGGGEDIVIYKNEVHHFGLTEPNGSDPDFIAVFVGNYCHRIWVLDNKLHDMSGSGVQVTANSSSTVTTTHVYGGRNQCYNLWGTGMASKTARYVVYSENEIYNIKDNGGISPSKGIAGQYGATDQWLLFNRIHDCAHGILRVSGNSGMVERLYVIGNVIYDIRPLDGQFSATGYGEAAIGLWGADENYIIGNVIHNTPQGIVTPTLQLVYAENNIVANLNETNGGHFLATLSGPGKSCKIRNNLFHQNAGTIRIVLPGEPLMNVDAINRSLYGSGNRTGDPLFASAATFDFTIPGNSPAKDSGLAPIDLERNVYKTYFDTFGISIERDKNGNVRPSGGGWDIGAYEFIETLKPTVPKPSGLKVEPLPQ